MSINYNPGIVTNGLVLCLDAGSPRSYPGTGTIWRDVSGTGNNGTLANGVGYNSSNLGSLTFDGIDDGVAVPNSSSLNFSSALTISSWFKFTALPTGELGIVRKELQWQLGLSDASTIRCLITTNGVTGWTAANDVAYSFATNNWYNMVMTFNGTNMLLYVNNILVKTASVTGAITTNSNLVQLGYQASYLNGNYSICQIYNIALSAAEITQNFNALRGRYGI